MEENTTLNQEAIETEVNETPTNEVNVDTTNNDENLFADSINEDATEQVKEETPTETPTEVQDEVKPFMELTYNKQKAGYTEEQIRELAQKGLNYDKIYDKYSKLNGRVENLARLNNMDALKFMDSLDETQTQFEISKEVDALKQKYPEANEELLKELAGKNVAERLNSQIQKFEEEKTANDNAVQERAKQDIETLKTEYGLTNEQLDELLNNQEFKDEVSSSKDAIRAYLKYQHNLDVKALSDAQSKAKIVEQNETNRKKSLGNISNASEDKEVDDFFAGLNSI